MLPSLSGLALRHPVADTGPQAIAPGTKGTSEGSAYGVISQERLRPGKPAWQLQVLIPANDVKDANGKVLQRGTRVEVEHYYDIDTLARALEHKNVSPTSRYEVVPLDRLLLLRTANRWRRRNHRPLLTVDFPRWVYVLDAMHMDYGSFSSSELDTILEELRGDLVDAEEARNRARDEYMRMLELNRLHDADHPPGERQTPPPFHGPMLRDAGQAMFDADRNFKALEEQWNVYSTVEQVGTSGDRVPPPWRDWGATLRYLSARRSAWLHTDPLPPSPLNPNGIGWHGDALPPPRRRAGLSRESALRGLSTGR